jgi:hypothetical protein
MNIETALLILESVLLLTTIALLAYSIRESRQRNNLILEVSRATKTLTRMEYFQAVTDSMAESAKEIIGCVTGHRLSGVEDERRIKNILGVIEKAVARGVSVRFLLPRFHDRLYMGFLYHKAGAEVRYSNCAMVYSLRYNVVDSQLVVMGIPEAASEEASTSKGHRLPSEALAVIMRSHFYQCWEKNPTFEDYLKEVLQQTGTSIQRLALETGVDIKQLEAVLAPQPHPQEKA